MTSITVLYGTTSANQAIPVLVDDAGQVVIDGGGTPSDSYWTLDGSTISTVYNVQGPGDSWSIDDSGIGNFSELRTLNTDGSISVKINKSGTAYFGNGGESCPSTDPCSATLVSPNGFISLSGRTEEQGGTIKPTTRVLRYRLDGTDTWSASGDGTIYCKTVVDNSGYDIQKIGVALSTIHDVVESVDDLQGLKNLLKLVLDNLKSDIPPDSEETE